MNLSEVGTWYTIHGTVSLNSIYFNTYLRVRINSQSIENNTSSLTVQMWIQTTSTGRTFDTVGDRKHFIEIDYNGTGPIGNGYEEWWARIKMAPWPSNPHMLGERTRTVNHNADGTKSLPIGTYARGRASSYGFDDGQTPHQSETHNARTTVTLKTIPRASTITSAASWTAPNARSVSISRASSSFTHTVRWQVFANSVWQTVKEATGVGTSHAGVFTTTNYSANPAGENASIFHHMNGAASLSSRIWCQTYNGTTPIGDPHIVSGTCTAVARSTIATGAATWNIGDLTSTGAITRAHGDLTHLVRWRVYNRNTSAYVERTNLSGFTTSATWNYNTTERNVQYGYTPNHNNTPTEVRVETWYADKQIRQNVSPGYTQRTGAANVTNSNPIFADFVYKDNRAGTAGITGNDQVMIQNQSEPQGIITHTTPDNRAVAQNSASMVRYTATLAGIQVIRTYSAGTLTFEFGKINASASQTLTIQAEDSRGNKTSVQKSVSFVAYAPHVVEGTVWRDNNYEAQSTISQSGTFSRILVGGVQMNAIINTTGKIPSWRRRELPAGVFGSWVDFAGLSVGAGTYSLTNYITNFDQDKQYEVEIRAMDKVSELNTGDAQWIMITRNLSIGLPLFFLDADKLSVGVNCFPEGTETFEIAGKLGATNGYNFFDTRAVDDEPQGRPSRALSLDFKNRTAVGNPPVGASAHSTFAHILTIAGWNTSEGSGGWPMQVSIGASAIAIRQATSATVWGAWTEVGGGGLELGTTSLTAHRGDHGVLAHSHISADGSSHSFINQSVTAQASPTFVNVSTSLVRATGTTQTAGYFSGGSTFPTGTTRTNYNGYLYMTRAYAGQLYLTSAATLMTDFVTEVGSNTNGRWVKFNDGTMIQWGTHAYTGTISTTSGNAFISAGFTLSFPQTVNAIATTSISCQGNDYYSFVPWNDASAAGQNNSMTTTTYRMRLMRPTTSDGTSRSRTIKFIVMGRWKA